MRIDVENNIDSIVVTPINQSIDALVADDFKKNVLDVLGIHHNLLVLDMKNVTYIDSTGLGSLIYILKHLSNDQKLALCNIHEMVFNVFKLTRLDKFFQIYPSRTSALSVSSPR